HAHGEARAKYAGLLRAAGDRNPVLNPDRAAVGFDDLLGDRQAQAGILPEALLGPVGVEALENLVERLRLDTGAVVIDPDFNLALEPAARNADGAPGRRE